MTSSDGITGRLEGVLLDASASIWRGSSPDCFHLLAVSQSLIWGLQGGLDSPWLVFGSVFHYGCLLHIHPFLEFISLNWIPAQTHTHAGTENKYSVLSSKCNLWHTVTWDHNVSALMLTVWHTALSHACTMGWRLVDVLSFTKSNLF